MGFPAGPFQNLPHLLLFRPDGCHRPVPLDNPSLCLGNPCKAVPQELHVVHADGSQHAYQRFPYYISSVLRPSQPSFQQDNITFFPVKMQERHCCFYFKQRREPLPPCLNPAACFFYGMYRRCKLLSRYGLPIDLILFFPAKNGRGSICPYQVPCLP